MCLAASRAQLPSRMNLCGGDLLCFEQYFAALLSPCDLQVASALYHEFASGFYHRVYHLVVMTRIMMKQQKRLNLRFECERNSAGNRTVSPADVRRVFLIGVLRVENQNVAPAQKLNQRSVLVRRNFLSLFRTQLFSPRCMQKKFIRLMIGKKSNRAGASENLITSTDAGMI